MRIDIPAEEAQHRYIGPLSRAFLYHMVDNPCIGPADFYEVDHLDDNRNWKGIPSIWD